MMVAYWLRNRTILLPRLLLIVGLILFAAAAIAENANLIDPAAALIVLGAAAAGYRGPIPVPHWLQTLGTAFYSIYLFQFVFIGVLWKVLARCRPRWEIAPYGKFPFTRYCRYSRGYCDVAIG